MNCNIEKLILYYWSVLINRISITNYTIVNALILYLALCIIWLLGAKAIKIGVHLVVCLLEEGMYKIKNKVLGNSGKKTIEYTPITLWFIKTYADISYFFDWLKYDVFKTHTIAASSEYAKPAMVDRVKKFSPDNFIQAFKSVCFTFFEPTLLHLLLGVVASLGYFEKQFLFCTEFFVDLVIDDNYKLNDILDYSDMIVLLLVLFFIVLDVRHKIGGYIELRKERFKTLIVLEEKLLYVLKRMNSILCTNITEITTQKKEILRNGASCLCGKTCRIKNMQLHTCANNELLYYQTKSVAQLFGRLDDMQSVWLQLLDIRKEFEESSLKYSNLYYVDYENVFDTVIRVWQLWEDSKYFQKMEFFCKTSMEEWYKNWFVNHSVNVKSESNYYSEHDAYIQIQRASVVLDFELQRAFVMQLKLRKYIRMIERRLAKVHKFSRVGLS